MAYNKDSVRQADKAGIFDSSLDASILETERDDRMRIKKELDELNKLDDFSGDRKDPVKSKELKLNARENRDKLKERMKLNIFDTVVLWLRGLFGGPVSQFKFLSKKELRRSKNVIQNFSPVFYNFKDPSAIKPRITRDFGRAIYSLYYTYMKLYNLMEDAVINEDMIDVESESFFIRYESELLSDGAKNILERLTRDRIVELYENNSSARNMLERELYNLKNEIQTSDYKNIEVYSEAFEAILLMRKLDFNSFFKLYDKNFVSSLKYNPSMSGSIYASELRSCKDFIKDLNTYLQTVSKISFPENVGIHFDATVDFVKGKGNNHLDAGSSVYSDDYPDMEKHSDTEVKSKDIKGYSKYETTLITSKDIKGFIKTVRTLVKSGVIDSMVKYIYKDPTYETKPKQIKVSFFDKYLKVLNYRIMKIAESSSKIVNDKKLKENIKSLFNVKDGRDININFIGEYNPRVNRKLEDSGLKTFTDMKSIALIKMFFERHYFKYMTEYIDKLVVEGEFSDKTSGTDFSNNIYEIEDDRNDLLEFTKLMTDSDSTKNLLRGVTSSTSLDSSQKNMLSGKIGDINQNAKNIVESVLPKLLSIQLVVDRAVTDSKSKTPNFVYNIKTISGLGNKAYINQLSNISLKINQFLNIMKNFYLVTKSSFKKN